MVALLGLLLMAKNFSKIQDIIWAPSCERVLSGDEGFIKAEKLSSE